MPTCEMVSYLEILRFSLFLATVYCLTHNWYRHPRYVGVYKHYHDNLFEVYVLAVQYGRVAFCRFMSDIQYRSAS